MTNQPPPMPPPGNAPPPPGFVPQGYAPPPPGYVPGQPYMAQPLGYAGPVMQRPEDLKARALVRWSSILGWGGLAVLFIGPIVAGVAIRSVEVAVIVAVFGGVCTVVGAVLGQIGRAMQGRVV